MKRLVASWVWVVCVILLQQPVNAQRAADQPPAFPEAKVREWFPNMARRAPLDSMPAVQVLQDIKGEALGWVFATDQVSPVVRGKRGEVGVWVGLARSGTIRGVKVGRHREDKKWFSRIRDPFYKAFEGQPADGSGARPEAVTGATVSSKAMVEDVFGACRTVLALPAVQAQCMP